MVALERKYSHIPHPQHIYYSQNQILQSVQLFFTRHTRCYMLGHPYKLYIYEWHVFVSLDTYVCACG